jgi:predicted O-linked N-acetylglucosamine transferase (SPINDLY family)
MTLQQQFESAVSHHQAGRLAEAEGIYRQVVAQQPNHVDALYLLGVLAAQAGNSETAMELLRRAIHLKPDYAEAHYYLGIALKNTGQLDEAIISYRHAIRVKLDFAAAHSNLGNALMDNGQPDEAIPAFRQALKLKPDFTLVYNNLGCALWTMGRLDEAIAACHQAIRLKPDFAEAYNNLGKALTDKGQLDEAIDSHRHAVRLKPDDAQAHCDLGNALQRKGQLDEAIDSYRQTIRLKPDLVEAHNNLGKALMHKGQLDEAIDSYHQAIRLKPDLAEAHNNLAVASCNMGRLDDAIAACHQAIRIKPESAEAHNNLGNALSFAGRLNEAVASYRQAIRFKPDLAEAHSNLGSVLKDMGRLDDAIASFHQAIRCDPNCQAAHSNLLYTLHFHPRYDAKMIYEEHRRWKQRHAEPLRKFIRPHTNNRDPDRPLRIGYVSPDFREHPVGRFLLPLLAAHDRDRFAVFCYSDVYRPDRFTELLHRHGSQWRNIVGLTDEKMTSLIREDQIDILVDLTMHMSRNRILLFARKPAPVQVTYLAYCSTTGLDTMDYRLTDPHLDPPGIDDAFYSEQSMRLPETYWCYPLHEQSPEVSPPPALSAGHVTFGSLNNFCKVSADALNLWIQLLHATPNSDLILHAHEGVHRQRTHELLEHQGIDPHRLRFAGKVSLPEYFKLYDQIDIALDPCPCNGGTTSCDALWMGVPVITLAGQTAVGRGGVSVLRNIGLPELIAQTKQQYIQIASDLAGDLPRLAELRGSLRPRMRASPLMDAPRFARNIEAVYRKIWQEWCGSSKGQAQ